jgi:hypothetical protein
MTFTTPEPVASGLPHKVTSVAGRTPAGLDEFLGDTEFEIDKDGSGYVVRGCGRQHDEQVLFQEKDLGHAGKDIRVWQITGGDDGYRAAHKAIF